MAAFGRGFQGCGTLPWYDHCVFYWARYVPGKPSAGERAVPLYYTGGSQYWRTVLHVQSPRRPPPGGA